MNVSNGNYPPQVTHAPRCPECDSVDTGIHRSQGIQLNHDGKLCRAQKQYRRCRECGTAFGVIHVKGEIRRRSERQVSGPWAG